MALAKALPAKALMVQGTASSVGKSLLTAALCRHFARLGVRVAPFKAQNMSNNAAVTADGGEIGRSQALQARACGVEPHVDMNPVLLKPEADHRSQVVVLGRAQGHIRSDSYRERRATLWGAVRDALGRLRESYELVIIEGAGSPAEINLREGDIVNMRLALHAGAPVLLVGDIDRGGVFGSLLGTLEWMTEEERQLVRGFVINRFRGDLALLSPAPEMLTERTGVPVLGVVPYVRNLRLPEEDAVALERRSARSRGDGALGADGLDVAVALLPRIANFDDIDPIAAEAGVRVRYVDEAGALGDPDLIVLPGTKATLADLAWLREGGLAGAIVAARGRGSAVIGLCGGYQMLGAWVRDRAGIEGPPGETVGMGLLPAVTEFGPEKTTRLSRGVVAAGPSGRDGLLAGAAGYGVGGYEIHMGQTITETDGPFELEPGVKGGSTEGPPFGFAQDRLREGALSSDGWVLGTYLHGLFHNDALRNAVLRAIAGRRGRARIGVGLRAEALIDAELDRLADVVEAALDMEAIHEIAGIKVRSVAR